MTTRSFTIKNSITPFFIFVIVLNVFYFSEYNNLSGLFILCLSLRYRAETTVLGGDGMKLSNVATAAIMSSSVAEAFLLQLHVRGFG